MIRFVSDLRQIGSVHRVLWFPEHLSSLPVFSGIRRVTRPLGFLCLFCRSLFVLSSYWSLCWLSFDLRILITPLVSQFKLFLCSFFFVVILHIRIQLLSDGERIERAYQHLWTTCVYIEREQRNPRTYLTRTTKRTPLIFYLINRYIYNNHVDIFYILM